MEGPMGFEEERRPNRPLSDVTVLDFGQIFLGPYASLLMAKAGAFVIKGEDVSWIPAIDLNRIILGAQVLLIVAILSWRSVARARARKR